jgi:hypothetical protein
VIKLISAVGNPLANQLLTYHALTNQFFNIDLIKNPDADQTIPGTLEQYMNINYEFLCR